MKPYDECNDFEKAARDLQGLRSLKWQHETTIKVLREELEMLRNQRHHDVLVTVIKRLVDKSVSYTQEEWAALVHDAQFVADHCYPPPKPSEPRQRT